MLSEDQKNLGDELTRFPMNFCNACFFGDPADNSSKVNNGTITLVKHKNKRFGITNHHVINEFRNRLQNEPEIKFAIGGAEINIEKSIIDEDPSLDLCTLDLQDHEESDFHSHGNVPTHFYEIDNFTTGNLKAGEFVLFGGYPGVWRERPSSNHLIFDTLSSGSTEVNELTTQNIRCELALDKCTITLKENHDEFPENLGGLSGGPVFHHHLSPAGISQFKLVGIIYEHMAEYDSILARPISFLDENFLINK